MHIPRCLLVLSCALLLFGGPVACIDSQTLYTAGRCENFSAAPLACQSTLRGSWGSVWTAPSLGLSQEFWEAQMYGAVISTSSTFVSYLDVISSLPYKGCAEAYAKLICPTFFTPCTRNTDPATNATIQVLPVPACRSVCTALNEACREFEKGADLLNCNATSALTGQPQWPEDSPACTTGPVFNDDDSSEDGPALKYTCPEPLVFEAEIPDQYTGLGCSSTCKEKMYLVTTRDKYYALYIVVTVLSWISFVCVCILMVSIVIFEPLRRFPTRIVFYICVGLFFAHLGPVGASFIGMDYACKNKTELAYGLSYCGFYAFCMYAGALISCIWWAFQAFIIFYNVALGKTNNETDRKSEVFVSIFGWSYSFIASIILTTVPIDGSGHRGVIPWCFNAVTSPKYHSDMLWGLWYPPVILSALLVTFFIGASVCRLLIEGFKSSIKRLKLFKYFMVMILFCIYFLIVIGAILGVAFDGTARQDYFVASISEWYTCVFSWKVSTHDCPKGKAYYGLYALDAVSFPLAGTVLFICFFVLRERTWRCWWQLFVNIREGRSAFSNISGATSLRGGQDSGGTGSSDRRSSKR